MESVNETTSFEANIEKALAPAAPAPAAPAPKQAKSAKPQTAPKPKGPTVGKKPTAPESPTVKPPIEGLAAPHQVQPPQPGSPCQVEGCLGRYSILQTVKEKQQRIRYLICRTCQHQPAEQHRSPL